MPLLDKVLKKQIKSGSLVVHYADGTTCQYGRGLPTAAWLFHDTATPNRILRDPDHALGFTYMEGGWSAPDGNLAALLRLLMHNFQSYPEKLWTFTRIRRYFQQFNHVLASRRNVEFHYDLDERLFRSFLDQDMHYSCGYFARSGMSLEQAQQAKCAHIMRKLALRPGQRVLDIGSGWGGLAFFLAEHAGVHVTGLTLSREQLRVAQQRARERGLADQVRFIYQDYREHKARYDRIVSVGMFEHVGAPQYPAFFGQLNALLNENGIALLHTIGRSGPPGTTNAWIRKHVFPGGYNPSLSEVTRAIEATKLTTTDIEVWRLHYALTLAEWQKRFQATRPEIVQGKGERFARLWEFYLASCEAGFALGELVVYQIQMSNALKAVPLTRDYLYTNMDYAPAPLRQPETQPSRSASLMSE